MTKNNFQAEVTFKKPAEVTLKLTRQCKKDCFKSYFKNNKKTEKKYRTT